LFAATFLIALLPLIKLTLTGEIQGRFQMLSITNDGYLQNHGGNSFLNILQIFLKTMR
jgi:hypothetical protein